MRFPVPWNKKPMRSEDVFMEDMSTPPPKPQRGILRSQNPVVVPPKEETPKALACQFKGLDRRKQLIGQFRSKLFIQSANDSFNGRDGMNAMLQVITDNISEEVSSEAVRDRAVKLLDLWLQECIIRPSSSEWSHEYQDDKKVLYVFNPPEHYKIVMTPRARSTSCDRKPSRKGSFRSLFKFGSQDNSEPSATLFGDQDQENSENPRLFGRTKPIRVVAVDTDLQDEAQVFEAALRGLLIEVEIPILDDVLSVKDCRTQEQNISFLSSILRRMGIGSEQRSTSIDDIVVFVKSCAHLRRTGGIVINWFHASLRCAPALHVERNQHISNNSQIHEWIKSTLKAVIDNYAAITNHGKSPLIPMEFEPFVQAICEQLCARDVNVDKRDRVLHYLWLMVPSKLRRHLSDLLDLIQATAGTDSTFSFRDPFFVNKQASEYGDNYLVVVEEVRSFIVPQTIPTRCQLSIIELYLQLRKSRNLDNVPEELKMVQRKPTFCHGEAETAFQAQQRVKQTVEGILAHDAFTPQRKKEMINYMRQQNPQIMSIYFPNI